jgi:hypothetical protein
MRALLSSLCLAFCIASFAGCGGEPEETGSDEGEPCTTASDCKSRLACFVAVEGEEGKCQAYPASCGDGAVKCSDDCMDELKNQCTGLGNKCISVGSDNVTVTCIDSL